MGLMRQLSPPPQGGWVSSPWFSRRLSTAFYRSGLSCRILAALPSRENNAAEEQGGFIAQTLSSRWLELSNENGKSHFTSVIAILYTATILRDPFLPL